LWKAPVPCLLAGCPPSEATWEPVANLVHAQDLVNQFHQRYPNKPAPSGRCRGLWQYHGLGYFGTSMI
jgi:hypothetical protein